MKQWKIVADSICDIREIDYLEDSVAFESVPLFINIDNETFVDDTNIDLEEYKRALKASKISTSTACPAPDQYANAFKGAENVVCLCVSKNLSGSYNSAMVGKELALEENPNAKIHVVNTASAGAEINIQVQHAVKLANQGLSFEELTKEVDAYNEKTDVLFILENVDNLVKAGRVSKLVGQMVGLLNIFLVGRRTEDGRIELAKKARGAKRAIKTFMEELALHNFNGNRIEIAHESNPSLAATLEAEIKAKYPNAVTSIVEMGALCIYYAETHGMLVGFERN